jgi:hypothetical protein
MKKLAILGIIGGAAILTAAPLSLQWSQKNVVLSLDSAKAGTATSAAGVSRRVHRRAYRQLTEPQWLDRVGTAIARRPTPATGYLTEQATPHLMASIAAATP